MSKTSAVISHFSPFHTELFSKNAVAVFADSRQSFHFARQIASLKNVQINNEPFYVMDMGRVIELLAQWNRLLPRVKPFYSLKCNADTVLLKLLADHPDVGFHCQTHYNLESALEFVPADRILYSNPCYTRSTLSNVAARDIQLLSFESARDLERILLFHPNAELVLNICVNAESDDVNTTMGCEIDKAPELLQLASEMQARVVGIGFNVGSGCTRLALYESAIEIAYRLFQIGYRLGLPLNTLNIGGGFSANLSEIGAQISQSLDYHFPIDANPQLRIIATPGRFFAGSVFSLVTNIVEKKSVDASLVTNDDFDCGNQAFIYQTNEGYYGSFGCRIQANCKPECTPLFAKELDNYSAEHVYASVLGPTLDEFDVVQPLCRFRQMNVGEWLMWANMGAYSLNNCSSLDEEQRMQSPDIFYFSSQSNWDQIATRKLAAECLLLSPTSNQSDAEETDSCTEETCSIGAEDEGFLSGCDDYGDGERLWMFGWPLDD